MTQSFRDQYLVFGTWYSDRTDPGTRYQVPGTASEASSTDGF